MRSKIFLKLLITLLLTLSATVLLLLAVVNWSFQQGFTDYLQQKELKQTRELAAILALRYRENGSWEFMRGNHAGWKQALETVGIGMPPPRGGFPGKGPPVPGAAPPEAAPPKADLPRKGPPPVGLPLVHRITLLTTERQPVFGPPPANDGQLVAITSEQQTVGWLSLLPIELIGDQLASSFVDQQKQHFSLIALALMLISLLVAALWARLFLRPVNRVVRAARQLAAGRYDARVLVHGRDELAGLALNFNRMAEVLQQNEQLRRRWLADISHELRTPLAVIGGEVEALLDGIRQPTVDRIESLHEEIGALTRLVEDLHQLSLADNAALDMHFSDCDLYPVVEHQVRLFQPRMKQRGLQLRLEAGPEERLRINADARRITQLISNLLENSLRYTDSGGSVRVQLRSNAGQIDLRILDTAPGVPDADLDKIFDRLYCVDKSRSRSVGGSGLGLAICKSIVTAHGGSIVAENRADGGLSISVTLPPNLA